jgi:cyclopropane-fatty-acyl-phospholipid synthase
VRLKPPAATAPEAIVSDETRIEAWSARLRGRQQLPLRVVLWNGRSLDFSSEAPRVTVRLPAPSALRYLLTPTLFNLGQAYVEGAIEVKGRAADMIAVVNGLAGGGQERRWWRPSLPFLRHTRKQDAAAIRYHYDVSNDFYGAWLDPAMVYSCAYFENGDETLAVAQQKKIDHILRKIGLRPGQSLLDIGCGWGALVLRAARHYGARCVGVTLSEEQLRLARERVAQAGLQERVEIRLQDYRDVRGQFDRITSVGMFEHVGVRKLPAYFRHMAQLLAPDGVMMNHGITSSNADGREVPHGGGKFIDRYVFPQGELAHVGTVLRAMQEGGLEAFDVENLRRHYARTCTLWTENFEASAERLAFLADPRQVRIWHVYLAGCAHAFAQDWISLYQVVCGKAGRPADVLPWSRRFMYP